MNNELTMNHPLIVILLCWNVLLRSTASHEIVVATYNLWNVMYHWEVRKYYIVEMIDYREHYKQPNGFRVRDRFDGLIYNSDPDIIGFQEVRANKDLRHTQLDELQELLPAYTHKLFVPLHHVTDVFTRPPGWEIEGVGFLSKHKVLTNFTLDLVNLPSDVDQNKRTILYSQFYLEDSGKEVNVFFNHFSYNKRQQCSNALELLKLLVNVGIENAILLGDFNVYEEFDEPTDALLDGYFKHDHTSLCIGMGYNGTKKPLENTFGFLDAWFEINPNHPGYTFSNMPDPGFINRPDRIFVSKIGLKLTSVLLRGKGALYRHKYYNSLWWARLWSIYKAMQANAAGEDYDRSCAWDCGPHGSCRCGICVTGGDGKNCRLSGCQECSPTKLSVLYIIVILLTPCFITIIIAFSLLLFGIVRPRWRRFCMYRLKVGRFIHRYTLVLSFFFIVVLYMIFMSEYSDVFTLINLQLYEEFFPSDHLMVVATVEVV